MTPPQVARRILKAIETCDYGCGEWRPFGLLALVELARLDRVYKPPRAVREMMDYARSQLRKGGKL